MEKKLNHIIWQKCIKYLQKTISTTNFLRYIAPSQIYIKNKIITIITPNTHIKDKIEKNYLSIIKNIMQNISDENYEIKINIHTTKQNKINNKSTEKNIHIANLIFLNKFILSAIYLIIKNPGKIYNPIYIQYNNVDQNQIKITNIILNKIKNIYPTSIIENETEIITHIKKNQILYNEPIVIIKNINTLNSYKIKKIINNLLKEKTQIILPFSGKLNKLTKMALLINLKPQKKIAQQKKVSINDIINGIINYYNINIITLKNKDRTKSLVKIRQIFFYLCKNLTNYSLSEISKSLNNYKHTTIIYSNTKIKKLIENNNTILNEINNIKKLILKSKNGNYNKS